ncbi:STAS domain-containing protein [Amycolatopsis sp. NPDC049252]|uniref:STAS domain-containing protein n=1 Tax=Amycolatopsis sp. NPDC049252 TaxID=3363933 RepID=UPI003719D2BE
MAPSAAPPDPHFSIITETRDDLVVVRATGELDLAARPVLEAALAPAATGGTRVVVDFTAVTFCTSGILGVLVAASLRGSRLVVAARHRAVRRPLELLGLEKYLTIVNEAGLVARSAD